MARVFKVGFAVGDVQCLRPADADAFDELLVFRGRPKLATWQPPQMYVDNPLLPVPDLWFPGTSSAIAMRTEMPDPIQTAFEMAGELLPMNVGDMELQVLNVLAIYNALDHDHCKWRTDKDGRRLRVDSFQRDAYAFFPNRFGESSIFKIPDENASTVLCLEREGDPETEFKAAVESLKLTGVSFKLLWEG